jgi:hypothetical protein
MAYRKKFPPKAGEKSPAMLTFVVDSFAKKITLRTKRDAAFFPLQTLGE